VSATRKRCGQEYSKGENIPTRISYGFYAWSAQRAKRPQVGRGIAAALGAGEAPAKADHSEGETNAQRANAPQTE